METINIVFCSDNNYAQPTGVAIYSLLDNFLSDKYEIKITVLDGGISEENRSKIKTIAKNFTTEIEFIKISNEIFKDCKYIGRYTLVAYYRLIIPDILGQNVKKAIYFDGDILVLGNIVELYEKDVTNYLIAAVQAKREGPEYFAAGQLLMNLEELRKFDFVKKVLDFIRTDNRKLDWPDQDILNFVCEGRFLKLEDKWGFEIERSGGKITPEPIILHYSTPFKPWNRFYHNYYQKYYRKYLKKWPDYRIEKTEFKVAIKQILKYIPFSIPVTRLIKKIKK
jgi:lipopolysaccharide biosynthesis glycosyltransferase